MGTLYYGLCHDCLEYISLDKFYSWSSYDSDCHNYHSIDQEDLEDFKNDGWIYRSLRLHFFIKNHPKHRLEVITEHDWGENGIDFRTEHKEVYPWPEKGYIQNDTVDFSDPKAGRLVVKTAHGDIRLDLNEEGVSCFRRVNGDPIYTNLLPSKKEN